ncbi:MFS transporter, partial [Burkholderia pseudomallei]
MPQPNHTDAAPRAAGAAGRAASPARPRAHARSRILALLAFGTMFNYLVRRVLG